MPTPPADSARRLRTPTPPSDAPAVLPTTYPTDPTATSASDAPPAVDPTATGASDVPPAARNATSSALASGSGGAVRAKLALGAGATDAADATYSCVWLNARDSTASRELIQYRHQHRFPSAASLAKLGMRWPCQYCGW